MHALRRYALIPAVVAAGLLAAAVFLSLSPGTAQAENSQAAPAGSNVIINEVDADQTSIDAAEFVELYDGGTGNTALDGMVLVFFNGNGDVSYEAFDLDGQSTDANGYFVLCGDAGNVPNCDLDVTPNTNLIQNGADAVALYVGNDTDFPDNTPVTTANLIDAIVYDTNDADDAGLLVLLNPGQPQVNEGGAGSSATHSNQRCPNGSGGARNTAAYIQELPTPGAANLCRPDLAVDKTGPLLALPGTLITYTIAYSNSGVSDATGVVIADVLPANVSYVSDDSGLPCPACSLGATGVITWSAGTVNLNASQNFNLVALVSLAAPLGTPITNTVAITGTNGDLTPGNNTSQWATGITPGDLVIDKQGPAFGVIGDVIVYTITLEARGVVSAPNTLLTDTLPVSTTYLSDDSGLVPANPFPGVYVWDFGDVPSGTLTTFNLTVTVDVSATSGLALTNLITASTAAPFDDPANNTAQVQTIVYPLVTIQTIQFVTDPDTDDASPLEGQTVWVEGIVTSEPGEIDNPNRLMVIEAAGGGPWSGLPVFDAGNFAAVYPRGTKVRVLGTVTEFFGLTELVVTGGADAVQVLSSGNPLPGPDVLGTDEFDDLDATNSEPWEGVYLEFQDADVTDENIGFGEWYFDDGNGPARADDLGGVDGDLTYSPALGDHYSFIRGIGWFSFGNYKLQPRDDDDIGIADPVPLIEKDAPPLVLFGQLFTYTISVQNRVGYELTGVVITDVVPDNATFAYALDGGSESGGIVTWNVGSLLNLETVSVRFAVTATNVPTITLNQFYAVSASNYPTTTFGIPASTAVYSNTSPPIHDIQGAAHLSPFLNADVTNVHGIVTVVGSNGFYMQDPNPDNDPATSEGIFVFTGAAPTVSVGDEVLVDGTVSEFYPGGIGTGNLPTTELINPTVVVSSTGNPLPAAIVLGNGGRVPPNQTIDDDGNTSFDPDTDGLDFYESLEGMLVQINDAVVVGGNRFGEIAVVGDSGANAGLLSPRGAIVVQPGDFNPERIIIDDAIVDAEPDVNTGDYFTQPITGVVDYSFGNFKVLNPFPLPPVVSGGLLSETTTVAGDADNLVIATLNVENLDPDPTDGDDDTAKFAGLADQIVNNLNAPDIIGLQEVQDSSGANDDGTVDATDTYNTLIAAILAAGGPQYEFREVAPQDLTDGGQPGGNIRVGLLFRPDRVTFVDRGSATATTSTTPALGATGVELSLSPGRIDPTNTAFDDSRKPLAAEFIFNGQKVFVVVVHFNSKGGDDPLFGLTQPPVLASETQRLAQAQVVNDFVDSLLALDPNANIALIGDLNDFYFSSPLDTVKGGVLHNLVENLPPEERYTFIFDGNAQTLDHILVSQNLSGTLSGFDIVHTNAEFDSDFQVADHDPLVASFYLPPLAASFTSNSPVVLGQVSIFTSTVNQASFVNYLWDFGDGLISTLASPTHTYAAAGVYPVTLTVSTPFTSVVVTGSHEVQQAGYEIYLPIVTNGPAATVLDRGPVISLAVPVMVAFAGAGLLRVRKRRKEN